MFIFMDTSINLLPGLIRVVHPKVTQSDLCYICIPVKIDVKRNKIGI